jgi:hypothetical protein
MSQDRGVGVMFVELGYGPPIRTKCRWRLSVWVRCLPQPWLAGWGRGPVTWPPQTAEATQTLGATFRSAAYIKTEPLSSS